MKKTIIITALILFILSLPWLLFSFVNWNMNPGEWSDASRTFAAFCWFVLTLIALMAAAPRKWEDL